MEQYSSHSPGGPKNGTVQQSQPWGPQKWNSTAVIALTLKLTSPLATYSVAGTRKPPDPLAIDSLAVSPAARTWP
eukprot:355823-Chlamydomonas_euryale.AAC.1